jgi:hypothetical protein
LIPGRLKKLEHLLIAELVKRFKPHPNRSELVDDRHRFELVDHAGQLPGHRAIHHRHGQGEAAGLNLLQRHR